MNVEQIGISKEEAEKKFKAYQEKVKSLRTTEVETQYAKEMKLFEKTYKLLAEGKKLLDLDAVVTAANVDDSHRPMLCIARSDRKQTKLTWYGNQPRLSFNSYTQFDSGREGELNIEIQMDRSNRYTPLEGEANWFKQIVGYSYVPLVPENIRTGRQLRDHYTLWEVKKWSDTELGKNVDRDPLLLKRLYGNLFSVEDSWDLTDVEALIMKSLIVEAK